MAEPRKPVSVPLAKIQTSHLLNTGHKYYCFINILGDKHYPGIYMSKDSETWKISSREASALTQTQFTILQNIGLSILLLWTVAVNILNKQPGTNSEGFSSSVGVEGGASYPSP
jgi:hypothetical protein